MTAGAPFPAEAAPYAWDASQSPLSDDVARLWHEVASGIDKSQTGTCMHPNRLSHGGSHCDFFSIVTLGLFTIVCRCLDHPCC